MQKLTAALITCCRASLPVVTAAVAVLIEGRYPSKSEAVSLGMLVAGVSLAVFEAGAGGDTEGIVFCVSGMKISLLLFVAGLIVE